MKLVFSDKREIDLGSGAFEDSIYNFITEKSDPLKYIILLTGKGQTKTAVL